MKAVYIAVRNDDNSAFQSPVIIGNALYVLVQVEAVYDDNGIALRFAHAAVDQYFVASAPYKHDLKISVEMCRKRPLCIILHHDLAGIVPHLFVITSHGVDYITK